MPPGARFQVQESDAVHARPHLSDSPPSQYQGQATAPPSPALFLTSALDCQANNPTARERGVAATYDWQLPASHLHSCVQPEIDQVDTRANVWERLYPLLHVFRAFFAQEAINP